MSMSGMMLDDGSVPRGQPLTLCSRSASLVQADAGHERDEDDPEQQGGLVVGQRVVEQRVHHTCTHIHQLIEPAAASHMPTASFVSMGEAVHH